MGVKHRSEKQRSSEKWFEAREAASCLIPVFRSLRQDAPEFNVSLAYKIRPYIHLRGQFPRIYVMKNKNNTLKFMCSKCV